MTDAALEETEVNNEITEGTNEAIQDTNDSEQTESAPVEQVESPAEADLTERAQARFNKITAEKFTEKRRADEAERKLAELQSKPAAPASDEPTLESFDFDEDAYKKALIKHQVAEAVREQTEASRQVAVRESAEQTQAAFNERIAALNKPDFNDVASAIPELPNGVADALVQSENGAELIYHLGTHLDMADKLANMSPQQAMMELGRISAGMTAKPEVKASAAPDPIAPLNSGGSLSADGGPKGATYE
jgi:hypothetical protein